MTASSPNPGSIFTPGELAGFGYSLPVDQPLYPKPPVIYQDTTILMYTYETDAAAARKLLPRQLDLGGGPVQIRMIFADYGFSSYGAYIEVAQAISCFYKGHEYNYPVRLHVTSDRAMASGREIGGFPKKIGDIRFHKGAEYLCTLDSPPGLRVCSALLAPKTMLTDSYSNVALYASLRLIPNFDLSAPDGHPSLCQLLETSWEMMGGQLWDATGNVDLTGASELDPYHHLPVVKPLTCNLYIGKMQISKIRLLEDLTPTASK